MHERVIIVPKYLNFFRLNDGMCFGLVSGERGEENARHTLAFWIARRAFSGLGVALCAACVFYYVNWGVDLACDKFKVEHGKIMRGCKFGCGVAAYLLLPVREDKIPLH